MTTSATRIHKSEQILMGFQNQELPKLPEGSLSFETFQQKFRLGNTSTEQRHPLTHNLSQVVHEDLLKGLAVLSSVDEGVIEGFSQFIPQMQAMLPIMRERV